MEKGSNTKEAVQGIKRKEILSPTIPHKTENLISKTEKSYHEKDATFGGMGRKEKKIGGSGSRITSTVGPNSAGGGFYNQGKKVARRNPMRKEKQGKDKREGR